MDTNTNLISKIANMEETIQSLQRQLREQQMSHHYIRSENEKKMKKLKKKVERIHETVHQLLGGLFHQEKQTASLESHVSYLFGREENDECVDDSSYGWTIYPTTRQGDKLEERMTILERIVMGKTEGKTDVQGKTDVSIVEESE